MAAAKAAVTGISGHSHAWAAHVHMALQRAVLGAEVPVADTGGEQKEAWLLVGDGQEGKRMYPKDAGLLSGPPHSLLSAEACVGAVAAGGQTGSEGPDEGAGESALEGWGAR